MAKDEDEKKKSVSRPIAGAAGVIICALLTAWLQQALTDLGVYKDPLSQVSAAFAFLAQPWVLLPTALAVGVLTGIGLQRWLSNRKQPASQTVPAAAGSGAIDETEKADPPQLGAPPARTKTDQLQTYYARQNAETALKKVTRIINDVFDDRYKNDAAKDKEFWNRRPELEAYFITMKKGGIQLPETILFDRAEMFVVAKVLREIEPMLDQGHHDEAEARSKAWTDELSPKLKQHREQVAAEAAAKVAAKAAKAAEAKTGEGK